MGDLKKNAKEVAQWGDMQSYCINIKKVRGFQKDLDEQEERMKTILEQERMILGCAGELEGFSEL